MANTARTQAKLAASEHFRSRLAAALASVAWQVIEETPQPGNYEKRAAYARQVLDGPGNFAARLAGQIVMRTNVFAFATTWDWEADTAVTASGDPDIQSQLFSDWDVLAGAN